MEMEFFSLPSMVLLGGIIVFVIVAFLVGLLYGMKLEKENKD